MIVKTDPKFDKHYLKRIASNRKLNFQFQNRFQIFTHNPKHPLLKTHRLSGTLENLYSFSVTGDIRVIFEYISNEEVVFRDIGSHNQVY